MRVEGSVFAPWRRRVYHEIVQDMVLTVGGLSADRMLTAAGRRWSAWACRREERTVWCLLARRSARDKEEAKALVAYADSRGDLGGDLGTRTGSSVASGWYPQPLGSGVCRPAAAWGREHISARVLVTGARCRPGGVLGCLSHGGRGCSDVESSLLVCVRRTWASAPGLGCPGSPGPRLRHAPPPPLLCRSRRLLSVLASVARSPPFVLLVCGHVPRGRALHVTSVSPLVDPNGLGCAGMPANLCCRTPSRKVHVSRSGILCRRAGTRVCIRRGCPLSVTIFPTSLDAIIRWYFS